MTDTIQKIAEEMAARASKLASEAGDGDHLLQVIGREVAETVNGWADRLRDLPARPSAGEGGEATPKALRMMANALSSRASYGRTTSFHAGTPADTKGTSDLMDSAAELLRRIADNLAAAPQPQAQDKTRPVSEWIAELRQDPEIAAGMDAAREKRGPRRTPPAHGDGEGDDSAFIDWIVHEMPAGTIIGSPQWWAPRIARAYRQTHLTTRPTPEAQEARDADTKRLNYIERTFSGVTNRERYLPVQMIWGKGCNGRTLREACDKYMKRDAALALPAQGEGK